MPGEIFKARFLGKAEQVPGISTFRFRPEKRVEFTAGQFAFFSFEFNGKTLRKHFTISSPPEAMEIELTTIVSDSEYKQALNSLEEGHPVEIGSPAGNFTLGSRKSDLIAFLAGGIGITPVKSILEHLAGSREEKSLDVFVFYSNRNEERIVFRERLEELAQKLGNVEIIHTLTDLTEESMGKWSGETGFVDGKMIKRHVENEQECFFYVVGPPSFNQAMQKMLLEKLGIKEEMVLLEAFTGY